MGCLVGHSTIWICLYVSLSLDQILSQEYHAGVVSFLLHHSKRHTAAVCPIDSNDV